MCRNQCWNSPGEIPETCNGCAFPLNAASLPEFVVEEIEIEEETIVEDDISSEYLRQNYICPQRVPHVAERRQE